MKLFALVENPDLIWGIFSSLDAATGALNEITGGDDDFEYHLAIQEFQLDEIGPQHIMLSTVNNPNVKWEE